METIKPSWKASRNRLYAGFWAAVLATAVLLPMAGLSGRRDEAPAGRRPAVVPDDFRNVDAMLRESWLEIRAGRYEAAVGTADKVLRIEPSNATALQLRGSALFLMKDLPRAKASWARALEIEPENRSVSSLLEKI
ncbi:MAG: hypothetical protein COR54_01955 [Elusimicrobia bacterium CG22_combo_CG10-13_8_21_14_all_63_91]|nr:MAG: hypothetical protein COR54_01955 [Elusimicrobia bacterium CG22_combo_CG10-13_8_21_14_all_63_91]